MSGEIEASQSIRAASAISGHSEGLSCNSTSSSDIMSSEQAL